MLAQIMEVWILWILVWRKKADIQRKLTLQHNVSYTEYFTGPDKLNLSPAKYSANREIFGSAWRHTVTMAAVSHA